MKIRKSAATSVDKVEQQMTPMIDVVFQLLTFFLFSFKIASVEGDFNIKMPLAAAGAQATSDTPPIPVRLTAGPDGKLAGISGMGGNLGSFRELHERIIDLAAQTGPTFSDMVEVELDCDYNLHYEYVVEAISAVSGSIDKNGNVVKLVEKLKFAPPKAPE